MRNIEIDYFLYENTNLTSFDSNINLLDVKFDDYYDAYAN